MKQKKLFLNIALLFGILLIIVIFEFLLKITGYGVDTRLFEKYKYKQDLYKENPVAKKKYFPGKAPSLLDQEDIGTENVFQEVKPENSLRGFVIGGSSAQGFPYEINHSFSKITQAALHISGKYKQVEIINLGFSAMSSYYVKDAAMKALGYDPDFIVIYSGHNEYYGTISQTTGGNYYSKTAYLIFSELRIFQLLSKFIYSVFKKRRSVDKSLMASLYNDKRIPLNDQAHEEAAHNFVRNINAVVKKFQNRDIPVIVMEPISNLYDMPPFSGSADKTHETYINDYYKAVADSNTEVMSSIFYNGRHKKNEYRRNANIQFLDAVSENILFDTSSIAGFVLARDLDTTPFRAKSRLIKKLRDYCKDKSANLPHLSCVFTEELVREQYGDDVLGRKIFIDHLHFNHNGHRIISRLLVNTLGDEFGFSEAQKEKIKAFYSNDSAVDQAIGWLPLHAMYAYLHAAYLTNNPPFSDMKIPFQLDRSILLSSLGQLGPELAELLKDVGYSEAFNISMSYYLRNRDLQNAYRLVLSGLFLNPGSYKSFLNMARFSRKTSNAHGNTKDAYLEAYLLSGKNQKVYDELEGFLESIKRKDLLTDINKKHGKSQR